MRRWGMLFVLLLLSGVIFSYGYLTNSDRVREMAESYLTHLLGGRVTVGEANLSIFEGLRLGDVNVRVNDASPDDPALFSAKTFLVRYDLRAMLRGKLVATQIIAIDPHVRLTEEIDSGQWNYQRLKRTEPMTMQPDRGGEKMPLPEIFLRSAQVDYSELRRGRRVSIGSLILEAQLTPMSDRYGLEFKLQSRGVNRVGPDVSGTYDLAAGQLNAQLQDFEFGPDIRAMLPAQVRQWWDQHGLAGRVDIPVMTYTPSKIGGKSTFKVETELHNVTLTVRSRELMSSDEADRRTIVLRALRLVRGAGFKGGAIGILHEQFRLTPIRLENVAGSFVFTETGIEVKGIKGRVETNGLRIDGRINGYSPDATFGLTITSLEQENIVIPASPTYVNSLPPQVREVYNRLRPQGKCNLFVQAARTARGGRPEVSGHVDVVDGQFTFDRFPYPLRGATGRIAFGRKASTSQDYLEIQDLRGHGIPGGPNENRYITVNGLISPFGPTSAVTFRVEGKDITCEPALRSAFPSDVRESLRKTFTRPSAAEEVAAGKIPELPVDEDYPAFRGDFVCDVIRPLGLRQRWSVNIDMDIHQADGALRVFPYPLRDVSLKLKIREGYVEIIDAISRQGDASLEIDGRVDFGRDQPMRPNLKVTARNVPIDRRLLAALSPMQRHWMEKLGIGGIIDIDGNVFPRDPDAPVIAGQSSVQYDFAIALRDGTIWPDEGTFAVEALAGTMRLAPQRLTLSGLTARRGDSSIAVRGSIAWPDEQPRVALDASATNLLLEDSLYALLPRQAKSGWDQVQPIGVVDAEINYSGEFAGNESTSQANDRQHAYELVIRPRQLSVTPQALPYRLDDLRGEVTVLPDRVALKDLTARHGDASVALSGTGTLSGESSAWDLMLSGRNVPVDGDLRKALPEALAGVIDDLNLRGDVAFEFSRLSYRPHAPADQEIAGTASPDVLPDTRPAESNADVDFVTKIALDGARVDVGVPLDQVVAQINLSGSARKGKLSELNGTIDSSSMILARRTVSDFYADLNKPQDQDALSLSNMRATLAGGEMAGQVDLAFPDDGPSRYAINLMVRDADVRQIAPQEDQPDIQGRLSASLSLEGDWSDVSSRRGRGDALVSGRDMYRIPLVLGLLQITNLALPTTTPFNEATARYSLDGNRVTFEGIEIKNDAMTMQGDGYMDFDTKQVNLSFATHNPNWPPLPIVGDLFRGASNELLRIHIRGSIEEPKVSAASMNTFTTTVDEVFKQ